MEQSRRHDLIAAGPIGNSPRVVKRAVLTIAVLVQIMETSAILGIFRPEYGPAVLFIPPCFLFLPATPARLVVRHQRSGSKLAENSMCCSTTEQRQPRYLIRLVVGRSVS